ncbi:MAG: TolC family protein, partial [Pseudomonadota bacterium]
VYTNSYSADLGASWQLDLFGKVRSANNAAKANALAAEYDLQGITQALIAELVYRRVSVYLNNKLLKLAIENSKNAEKLYITTKKRYELGSSSIKLADLYLVKENYESSKKDIYQYRRLVADEMYKLDILLAQTPGTITKSSLARRVNLPKQINAAGLPMQLLDRRPDLKSAEIRIVAANANIGVAIADLFPDLLISSGINYNSDKSSNLFNSENMSGSILGKITTKIFTGGALRSNIKIQESKARELSLNYSNKILSAIGEVESNLKAEQENMYDYKSQKGSLKLFKRTQQQSDIRYLRGIGTLAKLLENKRKTYNANKLLIASERALWKSRIDLYLSLGGDWLDKDTN